MASILVLQSELDRNSRFRAEVQALEREGHEVRTLEDEPDLILGMAAFEWCPGKEPLLRARLRRTEKAK